MEEERKPQTFGEAVRYWREKRGWTPEELAIATENVILKGIVQAERGLGRHHINMIERGLRNDRPTAQTITLLTAALGVTLEDLGLTRSGAGVARTERQKYEACVDRAIQEGISPDGLMRLIIAASSAQN